jgi:TolB-like protein
MNGQLYDFGSFVFNPEAGTLVRQGVPIPIGYRGLLLLAAFLRRPGEILSKSDLMDAAWPGMAVEEGNLTVQIASLRKLLGPAPDGTEWIKTVPRVGYRFTGSSQTFASSAETGTKPSEKPPSIAVLPFANRSDDQEQEFFADGLTEDIITRLARLRWLFVTARNSVFTYKGKAIDIRQVGGTLGVRYVLDGSVRRSGQRLRVNASLADAEDGHQVWSNRYDVDLADFFAIQDQIAESVIAAIEPQLFAAEHHRYQTRSPDSLDAWALVMKAIPHVWMWGTADQIRTAEGLLWRAIDVDPSYARAASLLAFTHAARFQQGLAPAGDVLPTARAMSQKAVQSDPEDPWSPCGRLPAHGLQGNG